MMFKINNIYKLFCTVVMLGFNATAMANCSINVTSLNFGDYDTMSNHPAKSKAMITFQNCNGNNMTISFNREGADGNTRRLINSTYPDEFLTYYLFKDYNHTSVWGDGFQDSLTVNIQGDKFTQNIYGYIPAKQDVAVGNYQGSVVMTIDIN